MTAADTLARGLVVEAPGTVESFVDGFPWRTAVDAVKHRAWRSGNADRW